MIHRLIATILTGLLLALGFSQLGCGKPSTVQQIGMSIWIVLLVVFAVITISFALEKSRAAAQRCVYAWMVFAAIVGGLLISFGCKSPAPGPTQSPLPSPTQIPSPSPEPEPEPEIRCGPSHALAPAHQRDCEILVDGAVVVEFSGERGRTGNFPLNGGRVWRGRIR
jgi:hypothetical protein